MDQVPTSENASSNSDVVHHDDNQSKDVGGGLGEITADVSSADDARCCGDSQSCDECWSKCWQTTPLYQLACCLLPCLFCCSCLADDDGRYCCFHDNGDEIYHTYTGIRTML